MDTIMNHHRGVTLSPAHFHTRLHPKALGYRELAQRWRDALVDHNLLNRPPNLIESKRSCTDKALSAFEGALSRGLAEDNTVDCPGGQYEPMCQ
jgi:hypothetical protein